MAVVGAVLAVVSVGVATLRSGLTGEIAHPFISDVPCSCTTWCPWAR